MIPLYRLIAHLGLYAFVHAQIVFVVFLALSILFLWWLKPWRMKATASAVVITPLLAIYAILIFAVIVPILQSYGQNNGGYNPWLNLVVMFLLVIFLPAGFYYFLDRLDRDRDMAPEHPLIQKIFDYIGMGLFIGFVMVMGFGNFFKPITDANLFSWHALTSICICIAGLTLFIRLVLGSAYLTASSDNPYFKELKRYYPALLYLFLGSTALALIFYGIDTIIK